MILKDHVDSEYSQLLAPAFRRTTALHLAPVAADTAEAIVAAAAGNPTGSRVGGAALVTADYPWPSDNHNKPMIHLAQLNLAELPARAGYPTEGLLQFFIADDDCLGLDFDNHGNGHVVRLIPVEEFATGTLEYQQPDDEYLIYGGFFTVTGQLYDQAPSVEDRDFEKLNLAIDQDQMYDILEKSHHTIFGGGWAYFTQGDPRDDDDPRELLFQLDSYMDSDSPVELMWGDVGVGNFFISKEDLARLDFNKVLYTWDCC